MPPKSNQVTLPFDKLTEKNLQPIAKKFKQGGYTVTTVDAPNKGKRESGMLIKTFTLTFEDSQQLLVRVKSDGTIFQVKLNNRVVPVHNVDNIDKAISEMCNLMYDNAKAFARAKAQRERRKLKPPTPSVTTTRSEKISKAKDNLQALTQTNSDMEKQLADIKGPADSNMSKLENAKKELEEERKRTVWLEAEIEKARNALA